MHYVRKVTEIPAARFFDVLCTSKPQHVENKELELEYKTSMANSFKLKKKIWIFSLIEP